MGSKAGTTRREVLGGAAGCLTAIAATPASAAVQARPATITEAPPISAEERAGRLTRVQALMRQQGIAALLVEAGSTLTYFTGVQWGRSERLTGALIGADGAVMIVTPAFEEDRVREMLSIPADVRTWEEDESPAEVIATWMRQRRIEAKPLAIEETVRFFAVDALRQALPDLPIRSGAALVNAVRMRKTAAEIALMQRATDITIAAYREIHPKIALGMSGEDISAMMSAAQARLGGVRPGGGAQIGEGSAYPHGSKKPEVVRNGSLILMDCTCTVDGYWSDVSRTFVFGEPTKQQRTIWEQVHRGQEVAFAAAKPGVPAGSVDDAVRSFYEKLGYGPRYRLPGLSHRTGHGIGLDVHEPVNLVHGETTPLDTGMCFSNEPGIYVPGAFGVRLEDCFYMTASGPRYFSRPPPSIDDPMG